MTNQMNKIKSMTVAAMLCAVGIIIPMFSPLKILIEPASFTLASHVAVFIAMFISPAVAISVAAITGVGFFIAGFPMVVVWRALTHIIFATLGALMLKKNGNILLSFKSSIPFALLISLVHAIAEVFVSTIFYFGGTADTTTYIVNVLLLVGVGTVVHSLFDFAIAVAVWKPLQHVISIPANAKIKAR
ncbi:hypothetical protein H0486_14680 [Lachnospiraceae bacterium MD1]|jgi:niacin transporter|uniref:Niacin transporter n=1 Tax=Variimorphobacter saccharofermentans TaxID=2755051 RepID=A0A839K2R6_9FIRM|nr:hypothetical protein [Variimorphobacter saccharofermentans]MBB2184124.1 hypothetical protein [Variimorphobacter saccharofermentans]